MKNLAGVVAVAVAAIFAAAAAPARADVSAELGAAYVSGTWHHFDSEDRTTGEHDLSGFGPTLRLAWHGHLAGAVSMGIAGGGLVSFAKESTTTTREIGLGTIYGANLGPELDWALYAPRGVHARFGFALSYAHVAGGGNLLGPRWSAAILQDFPVTPGHRVGFYARLDVDALHRGDDASSSRLQTLIPSIGVAARWF
jgi:hypothetical protein